MSRSIECNRPRPSVDYCRRSQRTISALSSKQPDHSDQQHFSSPVGDEPKSRTKNRSTTKYVEHEIVEQDRFACAKQQQHTGICPVLSFLDRWQMQQSTRTHLSMAFD
jgi:hypothetical protein